MDDHGQLVIYVKLICFTALNDICTNLNPLLEPQIYYKIPNAEKIFILIITMNLPTLNQQVNLIYKNLVFINRTKIKEDSKHTVHATENKEALNSL